MVGALELVDRALEDFLEEPVEVEEMVWLLKDEVPERLELDLVVDAVL